MHSDYLPSKKEEAIYYEWVLISLHFNDNFDGGTIELEFKYTDNKTDRFLVSKNEEFIVFQHWYPKVVTDVLSKRILKERKTRKRKVKNVRKPKSSDGFQRTA